MVYFTLVFVYIPPMGSLFYRDNLICPFDEIQDEITRKRATGSVIISGDWNARTGNLNEIRSAGHFMESDFMKRYNSEQIVNTYGRRLVELCKNNNMIIVNGRVTSEQGVIGNPFTCIKYNGVSTVDYAVVDYCALMCVESFSVLNKSIDSDHCPLRYTLLLDRGIYEPPVLGKNDMLGFYSWDNKKKGIYQHSTDSAEMLDLYHNFLCHIVDPAANCESVVQSFYGLVENTLQTNFRKIKRKSTCSFPRNPWFDDECKRLKQILRQAENNGLNVHGSGWIHHQYKRTVRYKKRCYMRTIAKDVDNMY